MTTIIPDAEDVRNVLPAQAPKPDLRLLPHVTDFARALDEQPDPDIIEKLEQALAWAKAGQLRAVGLALVRRTDDGKLRPTHWFSQSTCDHRLVVSAMYLQQRLMQTMLDTSAPVDTPPAESA